MIEKLTVPTAAAIVSLAITTPANLMAASSPQAASALPLRSTLMTIATTTARTHLASNHTTTSTVGASAAADYIDSPGETNSTSEFDLPEHPPSQTSGASLTAGFIIISVILSTIVVCTFVGNLFVVIAILIDKNLQTAANLLVLSLAVADFMVACLVMPLGAYNELYQGWYLGKEVCEFWTSADVLCCTASILNLLAIAMDRYWAVTNVDYIYRRTRSRVTVMIVCAWTVGAVVSLAPIFGWKDPDFAYRVLVEHKCMVSQDVGYQIFATISTFYAPLVLLLALYWRIFQVARKRIRHKPGSSNSKTVRQQLANARTLVTATGNRLNCKDAEASGVLVAANSNTNTNTTTNTHSNSNTNAASLLESDAQRARADTCGGGGGGGGGAIATPATAASVSASASNLQPARVALIESQAGARTRQQMAVAQLGGCPTAASVCVKRARNRVATCGGADEDDDDDEDEDEDEDDDDEEEEDDDDDENDDDERANATTTCDSGRGATQSTSQPLTATPIGESAGGGGGDGRDGRDSAAPRARLQRVRTGKSCGEERAPKASVWTVLQAINKISAAAAAATAMAATTTTPTSSGDKRDASANETKLNGNGNGNEDGLSCASPLFERCAGVRDNNRTLDSRTRSQTNEFGAPVRAAASGHSAAAAAAAAAATTTDGPKGCCACAAIKAGGESALAECNYCCRECCRRRRRRAGAQLSPSGLFEAAHCVGGGGGGGGGALVALAQVKNASAFCLMECEQRDKSKGRCSHLAHRHHRARAEGVGDGGAKGLHLSAAAAATTAATATEGSDASRGTYASDSGAAIAAKIMSSDRRESTRPPEVAAAVAELREPSQQRRHKGPSQRQINHIGGSRAAAPDTDELKSGPSHCDDVAQAAEYNLDDARREARRKDKTLASENSAQKSLPPVRLAGAGSCRGATAQTLAQVQQQQQQQQQQHQHQHRQRNQQPAGKLRASISMSSFSSSDGSVSALSSRRSSAAATLFGSTSSTSDRCKVDATAAAPASSAQVSAGRGRGRVASVDARCAATDSQGSVSTTVASSCLRQASTSFSSAGSSASGGSTSRSHSHSHSSLSSRSARTSLDSVSRSAPDSCATGSSAESLSAEFPPPIDWRASKRRAGATTHLEQQQQQQQRQQQQPQQRQQQQPQRAAHQLSLLDASELSRRADESNAARPSSESLLSLLSSSAAAAAAAQQRQTIGACDAIAGAATEVGVLVNETPVQVRATTNKCARRNTLLGAQSPLDLRRKFKALGQLISFVQTSRQFTSSSSTHSSQSDEAAAAAATTTDAEAEAAGGARCARRSEGAGRAREADPSDAADLSDELADDDEDADHNQNGPSDDNCAADIECSLSTAAAAHVHQSGAPKRVQHSLRSLLYVTMSARRRRQRQQQHQQQQRRHQRCRAEPEVASSTRADATSFTCSDAIAGERSSSPPPPPPPLPLTPLSSSRARASKGRLSLAVRARQLLGVAPVAAAASHNRRARALSSCAANSLCLPVSADASPWPVSSADGCDATRTPTPTPTPSADMELRRAEVPIKSATGAKCEDRARRSAEVSRAFRAVSAAAAAAADATKFDADISVIRSSGDDEPEVLRNGGGDNNNNNNINNSDDDDDNDNGEDRAGGQVSARCAKADAAAAAAAAQRGAEAGGPQAEHRAPANQSAASIQTRAVLPGGDLAPLEGRADRKRSSVLLAQQLTQQAQRQQQQQQHQQQQQQQPPPPTTTRSRFGSSLKRRQPRSGKDNMDIKRERKAAKTLAIITGVFVCCWLPFFLNAIVMPICGPKCTPSDLILSILLWLGYLNSLLNPLIYTIFSPDFRRAFRRLLCWSQLVSLATSTRSMGAPQPKAGAR